MKYVKPVENFILIFGAEDEEMRRNVALARQLPVSTTFVRFATVDGVGVTSSNAYLADFTQDIALAIEFAVARELKDGSVTTIVLVECGFNPDQVKLAGKNVVVLDHHREGDWGFSRPAREAIQASSLGQLLRFFALKKLLGYVKEARKLPAAEVTGFQAGQVVAVDGRLLVTSFNGTYELPVELAYVAALDHNPGAVYQGKVPGLNPGKAVAFRNELRAKFKGITVAELNKLMYRARAMMRNAPVVDIAGKPVLDLRGMKVPDSHEVSAQDGVAVMYSLMDRSGRRKEGIIGASEDVIDVWMSVAEQSGLSDMYGAPARGYAGGYHSFDVAHASNRLASKFNAARQ